MALESTDVFVVQKQTGEKENRKLSVQQLSDYLGAEPAVVFKGVANMTVGTTQPGTNGIPAPNTGDLWINNTQGTFAWTTGDGYTGTIEVDARAIWTGTGWAVTNPPSGDVGVETVKNALPITVDNTTASEPIVGVLDAVTTVDAEGAVTTQTSGVVTIATDAQITAASGNVVVTAKQLKEQMAQAGTGTVTTVTADSPLSVTTPDTTPNITIADADSGNKGVVKLVDASAASPDTSSTLLATVPSYVAKFLFFYFKVSVYRSQLAR